jgi:hypothetical protein
VKGPFTAAQDPPPSKIQDLRGAVKAAFAAPVAMQPVSVFVTSIGAVNGFTDPARRDHGYRGARGRVSTSQLAGVRVVKSVSDSGNIEHLERGQPSTRK